MKLLIIYDEDECETLDDAELVANLIQRTINERGRELGLDTVHINIVGENILSLVTGSKTK